MTRPDARSSGAATQGTRLRRTSVPAWLAVALAVGWGLWHWHAALWAVPYLDDNSVHEQMVRFAATRLSAGHSPYTSWFPYLGLGSPQFLHYQGLGATLAGALGVAAGGDDAFRLSLYLLLSAWPLAVYLSARTFCLSRGASAAAAVMAPFLASVPGVGYEPKAYVWIGWGVWTQLCASWALPFAWAFSWRALSSRRAIAPAVGFVALTVAFHFETGYLALAGVVVVGLFGAGRVASRLRRAALVLGGSLLASAWVIVPLVVSSPWAARNQVLAGTPLENGYGAKQVLAWLVTGRLYDNGRLPVVTVLLGLGLAYTVLRWRVAGVGRLVAALWAMSLVLSFGRTTFGSLTVVVPGGTDVFFRRFGIGAQLAGLYLAGTGAVVAGRAVASWARTVLPRYRVRSTWAVAATVALVAGIGVVPLVAQMDSYAGQDALTVARQQLADQGAGRQIGRVVAYVKSHGGGRTYAGMPSNWGTSFTVGYVQVFKYLESKDVDEVGYTLRTASLMTDPEYHFDETDPGDYALFGIRYLVLPPWRSPPVPARLVLRAGGYLLYVLPSNGYVRVVDTVGVLAADRTNVGSRSVAYLWSALPGEARYLTVAWAGAKAAAPSAPGAWAGAAVGTVVSSVSDLPDGLVRTTVALRRRAVVVLSASYDPGWVVTVDGHRVPAQMLAPALVGAAVGPGRHDVVFSYQGYQGYPGLLALSVAVVLSLVFAGSRRRRRASPSAPPSITSPAPQADVPTLV